MSRFEKITLIPPPKHELVRDTTTGLMWAVAFSAARWNFAGAEQYIADLNRIKYLGFSDWRMPTRIELLTLVDDTRCCPAIDTDAFPGTPSESFWTGMGYAGGKKNYAWLVHFGHGSSSVHDRSGHYRVRAVRSAA